MQSNMSSPFRAYDATIVDSVTQHWYDILDSRKFARNRTGVVELKFNLYADGHISGMKFVNNSAGDLLGYICEEAVKESAPFQPWPEDMRLQIGKDSREIKFTFNY
jgi:hypothetical protein